MDFAVGKRNTKVNADSVIEGKFYMFIFLP